MTFQAGIKTENGYLALPPDGGPMSVTGSSGRIDRMLLMLNRRSLPESGWQLFLHEKLNGE